MHPVIAPLKGTAQTHVDGGETVSEGTNEQALNRVFLAPALL